jgi:predicted acylesterase/phospholipase RssA
MNPPRRTLRRKFPFKRVALVLSGGGALGAYEIGVLRVLEAIGLRPRIMAGVSVGAINAVVWLAHGFRTAPLVRAWRTLRPSSIGIHWTPLTMRAAGAIVAVFATVEFLFTLVAAQGAQPGVSVNRADPELGYYSTVFEGMAWALVGVASFVLAMLSHRFEGTPAKAGAGVDQRRLLWTLGWGIVAGAALFAAVVALGVPWPRRVHAWLLITGAAIWFFTRPGRPREWLGGLYARLMPETGGRGLWHDGARRGLLKSLVSSGDPSRLVSEDVHLIVSACSVDDGRMNYFVNWTNPTPRFKERIRQALGEVVEIRRPRDMIEATVASTAVPVLFQPTRVRGREYLDGGLFSNQPLHAAVADGADAVLVVLVSPSSGPPKPSPRANVVELGARLSELANWRDLQTELRQLPPNWSREGSPAQVCVVEPPDLLPGSLLGFDPANAEELMESGARDAWQALERAGWIETDESADGAKASPEKPGAPDRATKTSAA